MINRGYQLSERAVRRIAGAVRKIEGMGPGAGQGGKGGRRPVYKKVWYRIAAYDKVTEEYTIRKQAWNVATGELEEVTDANDPEYNTDVIAYDCRGRKSGRPDEIVPGWKVYCDGQWVTLISIAEGTTWAKAVVPAVRGDDCAWIRRSPGYGGFGAGTPWVHAWPCNSAGDLIGTPPLSLTGETAHLYLTIYLPTGGTDPNIRGGEIIPCSEVSGEVFGEAHVGKLYLIGPGDWGDGRIGDTRRICNLGFGVDEGRGWYWKDDGDSHYMPNTDVDTLGALVANKDIEQTLDVEQGINAAGHDRPLDLAQGVVGVALRTEEAATPFLEVYGNYARTLERFN